MCSYTNRTHQRGNLCSYELEKKTSQLIELWRTDSFECELTLKGHKRGVESIEITSNDDIVSCSSDSCIKVWKSSDGYATAKSLDLGTTC